MDVLERVQQRATVMKGWEHLSCVERLRPEAVQPGEGQAQGDLINVCKYLKGGCKED